MILQKKNNDKSDLLRGNSLSYLKTIVIILIIFFIIFYFVFEFKKINNGPYLVIESPKKFETIYNNMIKVSGNVQNASLIKLNGRKIFVNQNGEFKENLLLYPGYNVMTLEVKDRFGEEKTEKITVFHKQKVNLKRLKFNNL